MFGLFGVIFLGIIWEALEIALGAIKIAATLARVAYNAVWCATHEHAHGICSHPWVRKLSRRDA
jgi:hypothetical protein